MGIVLTAGQGARDDIIGQTIRCLMKCNPEKIILFGSHARGDADEYSDYDYVMIKCTNQRFIERLIEAAKIINIPGVKADVFVYTPDEWRRMLESNNPFAQNVLREGRVLYEAG